MTFITLTLALATVASIQARTFDNPVIASGMFPGAIKVNGTYYVVTSLSGNNVDQIPIYSSTDLINWTQRGYLFGSNNSPIWVKQPLITAEIHRIGSNYVCYFNAKDANGVMSIGSAISSHPLGPYTPTAYPLLSISNAKSNDPTIIKDGDKLYLAWSDGRNILARELDANGLNFASVEATTLLSVNFSWEGTYNDGPWYLHRGDYHYIFYSGGDYCIGSYSTGVARSVNALGPYEKQPSPILSSNSKFTATGHMSVVKDLDEMTDIVVFQGLTNGVEVCDRRSVLLSILVWNENNWPYLIDF